MKQTAELGCITFLAKKWASPLRDGWPPLLKSFRVGMGGGGLQCNMSERLDIKECLGGHIPVLAWVTCAKL